MWACGGDAGNGRGTEQEIENLDQSDVARNVVIFC